MDSEQPGSRRIYNVGPYGGSRLLQDYTDLNASGGAKRYDQVFDSQISQSQDHSQDYSRQYYDQNLSHSQQYKRSDTEPVGKSSQQVSFATQNKSQLNPLRPVTSSSRLERIEEGTSNRSGSRSKLMPLNSHMVGVPGQYKTQLEDITSQSNKLEESVQAPGRPPQRVPGLTAFLCEQHFKKTGVFTKSEKELFKFWKSFVSFHYKELRNKKGTAFDDITHNSTLQNAALGKSFMSQTTHKSAKQPKESDKGALAQYKKFERLFEMDVMYTIQKDIEEEKDDFKKLQVQKEYQHKQHFDNMLKQEEESVIQWMIEEYYTDLKEYQILTLKDKDEKTKELLSKSPSKDFHKQVSTINPVESMDEVKNEPQKPMMTVDFEKEKEKIETQLNKEKSFMQSLFFMVRDEGHMTNDPQLLIRMYKQQKEKARLGVIWAKGDDDAEHIIKEFFKPEKFLKRLTLFYGYKNRQNQCKHLSLFGFYLQLKPRQKLLCLIDRKPIKCPKKMNDSMKEEKKTLDGKLTFSERQYSVEEIISEYEQFRKYQNEEQRQKEVKEQEEREKKTKDKIMNQVFGKEKKLKIEETLNSKKGGERFKELAQPKDKWKRGKILLEMRKKFPHDIVLQKMIREEFKENKVFKYPEEYDLFNEEEDKLCKHMGSKTMKAQDLGAGKSLREKFKVLDDQELYYLNQTLTQGRQQEHQMDKYLIEKAMQYLDMKKKRLHGQEQTLRDFLSETFNKLHDKFHNLAVKKFPHITYGTKKNSDTYKKSYPQTFKRYFFKLVKSYYRSEKGGLKRLRNAAPTFMIPGGKRCTMHQYECPEDCQYVTLNKKILLKSTVYKRKVKEPHTFRSRVWRRRDFKNALNNVLMLRSEIDNCTFEPEAGSMSKTIQAALKANPNLQREGYTDEPDPEAYFKKLGKNFESSHPEVYKAGVLKRAKLKYMNGKYEEAMNTLYDGFNVDSIKKRYDPHYMKRFMAEMLLKKKTERQAKEQEEKAKGMSLLNRMALQKEQPESQKKRPEEDFENLKLLPILREAFDLVTVIENRKKDAEKKIKKIERSQRKLKTDMRSFSVYKKSQTRVDFSKGEKIMFRTIMCPLRDKCPKVKKPRWPTSNIKCNTKFGEECPFAHHPMELKFPESIVTKLSASMHTIKSIKAKIDEEKPKDVFKPTGALFDCVGCNNKSGKHIGGPCNLCRYKEMANTSTLQFTDKKRKESLMRSMERRESKDIKQERQEMHQIMQAMDLDNNYAKKFGFLKKACVLFFYGRYNDSFDEIAKSAKIVQDQKEIEKQKQLVIEKRWKFKLGLDDGFELPVPIETIDISKVDEKFLKKMDLQGVSLATVKLFIEQVSPQRSAEYSKHVYLNKCIEDFYLECEAKIDDRQNTIKKMKKQVEKLDEEADLMEAFGSSPERSPEKGETTIKIKPKKTKMCPTLAEKGKCPLKKEKKCPYAHNPIELDLIPVETKMKNLNGVIHSQTVKLKNMKPLEPWKPAKSGDIEHTHLMDMTSKKKKKGEDDDEDDEENDKRKEKRKKSIFERENLFRKPYETNE